MLIVTDRSLSSSNHNNQMPCLEMVTYAMHFTECNDLCRLYWGDVLPQQMSLTHDLTARYVHISHYTMRLIGKPDIVEEVLQHQVAHLEHNFLSAS